MKQILVFLTIAFAAFAGSQGDNVASSARHTVTVTFGDGTPYNISYGVDNELPIQLDTKAGKIRLVGPDNSNLGWIENRSFQRTLQIALLARQEPLLINYNGRGLRPGRFILNTGEERIFRLAIDDSRSPSQPSVVPVTVNNVQDNVQPVAQPKLRDLTYEVFARDYDLIFDENNNATLAPGISTRPISLQNNAEIVLMQSGEQVARVLKRGADVIVWCESQRTIGIHYGIVGQTVNFVEIAPGKAKQFTRFDTK